MGVHEYLWASWEFMGVMGVYWCLWVFMGVHRCLKESMGARRFSGVFEFLWVFMGIFRFLNVYGWYWGLWVFMDVIGVYKCMGVYGCKQGELHLLLNIWWMNRAWRTEETVFFRFFLENFLNELLAFIADQAQTSFALTMGVVSTVALLCFVTHAYTPAHKDFYSLTQINKSCSD